MSRPTNWDKHKPSARCPRCKLPRTPKGHDPCIANLPGVDFACCGHGDQEGYIAFKDGHILRGYFDHDPQTTVPSSDWNKAVPVDCDFTVKP